jgi:tetratricopeptide (TPR) repeat protein
MEISVNPLAVPKGKKVLCEICQQPAHLQCALCKVTCYCGQEHRDEDLVSIHEKICSILSQLKSQDTHATSESERREKAEWRREQQRKIVDIALSEGYHMLHSQNYSRVIPAALQALHHSKELYGNSDIRIVPTYMVIARAAIGSGRLEEARQYLSQAQWVILSSPNPSPEHQSQLHRNLGLLALARGETSEARRHLAEDIYQSSVAFGPETVQTAGGYFHLATAFAREDKPDVVISLHNQVIKIWTLYLKELLTKKPDVQEDEDSLLSPRHRPVEEPLLSPADKAEVVHMLTTICALREKHTKSLPPVMINIYQAMALLSLVLKDHGKARDYLRKAVDLAKGSQEEELVRDLRDLRGLVDQKQSTVSV